MNRLVILELTDEIRDTLARITKLPCEGRVLHARTCVEETLNRPCRGKRLEAQILCILDDLRYWKGYDAQVVKDQLREFVGLKLPK